MELAIRDSDKTIPPPNIFSSSHGSIDDFLVLFERYCVSIYGEDRLSWLQVLPSYLEGEARNIVLAFGLDRNIDYAMVNNPLRPKGHICPALFECDFECLFLIYVNILHVFHRDKTFKYP